MRSRPKRWAAHRPQARPAGWALGLCAAAVLVAALPWASPVKPAEAAAAQGGTASDPSEYTGGQTTVFATGKNAFSFPFANLADEERTRFVIGNSFFKRNWVEAPASTRVRDGLGPHFIARSCGGCHVMDGRGEPPDYARTLDPDPEPTVALLMRLSVPGRADPRVGVVPEPTYGDQFGNAAVQGVRPEGVVRIHSEVLRGHFADGTAYELIQPRYTLTDLGYGPLAPDVMVSPRIAPQAIGVGLLEAIAEADILANARAQAALGGPIRGQVNRVWDAYGQREAVGRFGWKANAPSVAHQTSHAFLGDIGITSRVFPREACMPGQADCLAAPHGGGAQPGLTAAQAGADAPEIDDKTLDDVIFYQATLAPPARRNLHDPVVRQGEKLFTEAQCAVCHKPSYVTGEGPFPRLTAKAIAGQRIWPYTDLLLHDMGPALADGRPDFLANGQQWRTPPLWGIGLLQDVNGHQRLLHDGRARGVLEAILWHGGEAEAAKQRVLTLSAQDRDALVKFVESL
ncbi:thiol oxidoreductase [Comamonas serinivorans]|uniref:Thiol oxidoreductase n=1 Tax=Comamonas serinivorans TaxID=1082851 RepID=A0A1Y0EMW6_9BURK|nr:di-heme oxidoredictase family protein [Comamonas serinivorans]ARU05004.1 thiol oxidoreductase [Comamonas serinivorans]